MKFFPKLRIETFMISTDCRIKTCRSLRRRALLNITSAFFRRTYVLSVGWKIKSQRKSVFLCWIELSKTKFVTFWLPCVERSLSMEMIEVHAPSGVSEESGMHFCLLNLLIVIQEVYILCFPYFALQTNCNCVSSIFT